MYGGQSPIGGADPWQGVVGSFREPHFAVPIASGSRRCIFQLFSELGQQ